MPEIAEQTASWLIPVAGPTIDPIAMAPKSAGLSLGRHEQCDIYLPSSEKVSRFHARFAHDGSAWRIADLNSRWGTYLNGQKLMPGSEMPLQYGDLIRIAPWTFSISSTREQEGLQLRNDAGDTVVSAVPVEQPRSMQEDMLVLLLEAAAAVHGASDEKQLAEMVMDVARRGTGLPNAAVLRPVDGKGHLEVVASRLSPGQSGAGVSYSRSLIAMAATGVVAEISGDQPMDISQSIVQMKISSAICVPLMLGGAVAAYLYLDARTSAKLPLRPHASAFCVALGRMASLALSNLKRIDIERRQAAINLDLAAAATAQKWIMPQRRCECGGFVCVGESKPGQYVGGDFFDIIEMSPTRVGVAVGDVTGKGVTASVLMTATQGFLHASLLAHTDLAFAINATNRFICPRRPDSKFVTLWAGVIDRENNSLSYIDAGHSYAVLCRADGRFERLDQGGDLPMGVDNVVYEPVTTSFNSGDSLIVVSDGIIEQYGMVQLESGPLSKEHFEVKGLMRAISESAGDSTVDEVAAIFAAVVQHAGTDQLADDATAVVVRHL